MSRRLAPKAKDGSITGAAGSLQHRWIAAGVRHEVLLRTLPSLRHDMAAPVSVLRMATLLLKRQLTTSPVDLAACGERVDLLEQQLGELIDGIRLLRGWEGGADGSRDVISRPLLVSKCVALLKPGFDLRGVALVVDPVLEPGTAHPGQPLSLPEPAPGVGLESSSVGGAAAAFEPEWPGASALRYLLLAALCYLDDTGRDIGVIRIAALDGDALQLFTQPRAGDARPMMAGLAPPEGRFEIDAAALQCLADDLGHGVDITANGVRLRLAADRPAAAP